MAPADGEIAEAMWVTRADLRVALQAGDWGATEAPLLLPGKVSIARSMIESWAAAAEPGCPHPRGAHTHRAVAHTHCGRCV